MPTKKQSGNGSSNGDTRPYFRPRVVIKLQDWVDVPYAAGAEEEIVERFGSKGEEWRRLEEQFGDMTLVPLYTAVSPDELQKLVDRAAAQDESYRPPNLFTWYTVDTPGKATSEELARVLLRWELVEKAYADARPIDPMPVTPVDDPRSPNQGYLDPAPDGIDAEFAWSVPGGDGAGQSVIDLEGGWTLAHEDLTAHGATVLFGSVLDSSRSHGTAVLGEICAVDNALGGVGITPNVAGVHVVSHSGSFANVSNAIVAAITASSFGDVLLLEMQTTTPAAPVFGAPVELIDDIFESIRLAVALGIVVVEAGGNGSNDLTTVTNFAGLQVLNTMSGDFRDSGAIIVGAGSSLVPHTRMGFSSFGARVNCYAWGENVDTTSSDNGGSTTLYTGTFSGTSSASPIITGAALAVQGIVESAHGYRLSPTQMRAMLSDPATGTASANPATDRIGVMPDLHLIVQNKLNVGFADLYLRDYPGDVGNPHSGPVSVSPDVIPKQAMVASPQNSFGEGSGTENNQMLGDDVEGGQDNYIYVRARNRGAAAANNAVVTLYWSEVGMLITPDQWNLIGTATIPTIVAGNILTVSDAILWPGESIPASGHYCFIATIDTPGDPVPPLASLATWDNFIAFIRNDNNVTWRNFNVVDMNPSAQDPSIELPVAINGAADRAVRMGLNVYAGLPEGARLALEAPAFLLKALGFQGEQIRAEGESARVSLNAQGRQHLGMAAFPAKLNARAKLIVQIPGEARKTTGWRLSMRQFAAEERDQFEVGRVEWYFAGADFFEHKRKMDELFRERTDEKHRLSS